MKEKTDKKDQKQRGSLSLTDLILFGLGNVVGAGIFIIISKSIFYGGNFSLYALATVATISMIMGFCYIEIYGRYSSSITEYLAVKNTMGEGVGQITLYAIYMFALLSGVTIVTAMAKYACKCDLVETVKHNMSWTTDSHHSTLETAFSVALLCIMAGINFMGIETSKVVANTISVVMLVVILGIIVLSLPYIKWDKLAAPVSMGGSSSTASTGGGSSSTASKGPWDNFVLSAILSLFLYNGYDFLVKISDESADPENNKTALISTIGITTLLYAGIMIAGICVLGYKKAGATHNIVTNLYEMLTTSKWASAVYMAGLFIMFNTGFLSIMSATKFMEGLGKDSKIFMPEFWAKTNEYDAPSNAIWISLAICVFFALFNNATLMAIFSNFTCVATLILISIALLILRWQEKDDLEAQLKYNYIWGNVSNMPVPVIANLGVLFYIMYEMFKNKFWIHVI
jgi:APA family basic amino acid/polyamine antiporter